MKKVLLVFLIVLPSLSFAQEIKSNVVDPFSNERTIETDIVSLKQGATAGFGASYLSAGRSYFMNIIGYGNNSSLITEKDKVWLVLEDGRVIHFNSALEMSDGDDDNKNIYIRRYLIKLTDVEILKNKKLAIVRIVSPDKTIDVKVSNKNSKQFSKLSDLFLTEVSK